MTTPIYQDDTWDLTTTTGTGTLTLALTPPTGYTSFAGLNGEPTAFKVYDTLGNWEVTYGTVGSSGASLTRTTVYSSSNGGSLVNFPAGTKNVICVVPAGDINSMTRGSGTTNEIPVWTGSNTLGASHLSDNGTDILTSLPITTASGNLQLDAVSGNVYLGSTTAGSVNIGNGGTTTVTGSFVQGTGTFSLTGSGGSNVYAFGGRLLCDSDTNVQLGTVFSPHTLLDGTTVDIGTSSATTINIGNASTATTTINIAGNAPTKNLNIGNNSLTAASSVGGSISITGNTATNASGATASGSAQTIAIAAGNGGNATTTSGGVSSVGAAVSINGGNGGKGASSVNAPGVGGAVNIAGGTGGALTSGFSGATGGNVTIDAGTGSGNGRGGSILIGTQTNLGVAGTGSTGILIGYGTTSAGVNGANVGIGSWNGGAASGSTAAGTSGTLFLSAGNGGQGSNSVGGTSSAGGAIAIAAGNGGNGVSGNGASSGGNITITAGNAGSQLSTLNTCAGGSITITAGNGNGTGTGGAISIQTGTNPGGTAPNISIGTTSQTVGNIIIGNTGNQNTIINLVPMVYNQSNCLSLASTASVTGTTFANTNFVWFLQSGSTYNFDGVLSTENTTAGADGVKLTWNNSSCGASNFFSCINVLSGTGTIGVGNATSIATTLTLTAVATTPNYIGVHGMIVCNSTGDLQLAFASNAGATAVAKILAGSYITLWQNTPS